MNSSSSSSKSASLCVATLVALMRQAHKHTPGLFLACLLFSPCLLLFAFICCCCWVSLSFLLSLSLPFRLMVQSFGLWLTRLLLIACAGSRLLGRWHCFPVVLSVCVFCKSSSSSSHFKVYAHIAKLASEWVPLENAACPPAWLYHFPVKLLLSLNFFVFLRLLKLVIR